LLPLWHVAGFALGAATAALGHRAAMACTVAVEEAIDEHYQAPEAALGEDEAELKGRIAKFRADELEHRDIGLENEAELTPAYRLLSAAIKTCLTAWVRRVSACAKTLMGPPWPAIPKTAASPWHGRTRGTAGCSAPPGRWPTWRLPRGRALPP
jgi:hypothetical protein